MTETAKGGAGSPILTDQQESQLDRGLRNLEALPAYPVPIPGHEFEEEGLIGFRRRENILRISIACERAEARFLDLAKFCAMVEHADEPEGATVMLENFKPAESNGHGARGQKLACLNLKHSAIEVVQGLAGKILRNPGDIVLYHVYYLRRELLEVYYKAARYQLGIDDRLDELINRYEGWKEFHLPLNVIRPTVLAQPDQVEDAGEQPGPAEEVTDSDGK